MTTEPKIKLPRVPSERELATRIKPGEVRNPNGRPKKVLTAQELEVRQAKQDLRRYAKEYSHEAFECVLGIMRNEDVAHTTRLAAAVEVLNRGHGKPTNHVVVEDKTPFSRMSSYELLKVVYGDDIPEEKLREAAEMRIELGIDVIDVTPQDDEPDAFA